MIKTVTVSSPQWKQMVSYLIDPNADQGPAIKALTSLSILSVVYRNLSEK